MAFAPWRKTLTEADIQQTVCELLTLDGWHMFRTELTVQRDRGRVVGERGMPDVMAVRYGSVNTGYPDDDRRRCFAQLLYIEFKAPGKNPPAHQLAWHAAERTKGALVLVVDDIEAFRTWYAASGLSRRLR